MVQVLLKDATTHDAEKCWLQVDMEGRTDIAAVLVSKVRILVFVSMKVER